MSQLYVYYTTEDEPDVLKRAAAGDEIPTPCTIHTVGPEPEESAGEWTQEINITINASGEFEADD